MQQIPSTAWICTDGGWCMESDGESARIRRVAMDSTTCNSAATPTFNVSPGTYVKTKNREVEPTRRQAAVHTGMKALGFSESAAAPAGILTSPLPPHAHHQRQHRLIPTRATAHTPGKCSRERAQRAGRGRTIVMWRREGCEKAKRKARSCVRAVPQLVPVSPGWLRRTDAASGLSQRWSFDSWMTWGSSTELHWPTEILLRP